MFDQIPPEIRNAGPGVAGSLLALIFMRRPKFMLAGMFVGGCLLSYLATPWLAIYLEAGPKAEGLIGFLVGMFGMTTVAKVYDLFEAIEAAQLWKALLDFARKKLGIEEKQ
jgi:hypothetical protein